MKNLTKEIISKEIIVSSCLALILLLSCLSGQAAPQQQQQQQQQPEQQQQQQAQQVTEVPPWVIARGSEKNEQPGGAAPSQRDAAAPGAQQVVPPASNNALPSSSGSATILPLPLSLPTSSPAPGGPSTPSPFIKLATAIPELDFNKELLDYDHDMLATLKFYPPIGQAAGEANQTSPTSLTDASAGASEDFEKLLINRYHDNEQLHAYLLKLAQAYPRVTRLYDIGQSVDGRKLWVFEISERPGQHELLKPDFRYVANIHGNEAVGRELLLHLARLILENYHHEESAADASRPTGVKFIKKLVKATRIHLMPSANPDGFARSDIGCMHERPSQRGRVNANNVDLNRNFPDAVLGTQVDLGTQPEVRAIIDWSRNEPFVLSANLHGGAVAAIIPYDSSPPPPQSGATAAKTNESSTKPLSSDPPMTALVNATKIVAVERRTPDHAIYMELARAYSRNHPTMWRGEMCYDKCTEYHAEVFPDDGITVGSAWYSIDGSLQDWAYANTNDFHVTLEIGCNQYPPAAALHQYWQFNKVSLLSFMRQVHRGIKGVIVDESSQQPLSGVRVHVRTIDHNVTSTRAGDYFRLLAPGNYHVLFEHRDYHPVEIFVSVRSGMAQIHNIKMEARNSSSSSSAGAGASPPTQLANNNNGGDGGGDENSPQQDSQHSIAVATLVMSVITILLLILLAGSYVIQKRRYARSQSVSVELQPSGRSAPGSGSTGLSLPPLAPGSSSLKSTGGGGGGVGRTSLSPHASQA